MNNRGKASFYSKDLSATFSNQVAERDKKIYTGEERRRRQRRVASDRRANIRFDIKGDRRQSRGRRSDDQSPDFW